MEPTSRSHEAGMALLVALLFISVALVVLGGLGLRMMNQRLVVDQYQTFTETFQGLESAAVMSKVELENGGDGIVAWEDWSPTYAEDNQPVMPAFDEEAGNFSAISGMPHVKIAAYAVNWAGDGRDSNGDGVVDSAEEAGFYTIYVQAAEDDLVRRAEVVYEGLDVNVWRNAIFAGAGQAGGLINGNVSIHGAVHLLGQNIAEGNTAIAAIDLSGTSLIHNNYEGMPADLRARIPALPMANFDGEMVETIEATLRVKNGLVSMSGNSEIGEPHQTGNAYKETMDGTYVTDGWTGNSVTDDGDRGDPSSVHSDNGWDEEYDLGDKVPFPRMTDDWREPVTGARIPDPVTGTWYTHEDYFNQVLVADSIVPDDGAYNGDITIDARGQAYYWNASTGEELTGAGALSAAPGPNDDYIQFDPGANLLRVNGQVRINGNITFTGQGGDHTINYSGRAAMLVYGDVNIEANLLTCNNGDPSSTANSFPLNNILGIMSSQNMYVGTTAQLSIMGAFYAQQQIKTQKQTNVLGTFVSQYFDMGTNVPSIFQVPELADNLPLGMIGNYPLMVLDQISWRELHL